MVATTFAADTPLAVTGMVARHGIAGNWLWWNMVMGGVLTVFFFARLWRRALVSTDAELAELRYSGRPAALLRGFRALYLALPVNLIVMGWVNLAMIQILRIMLGLGALEAMAWMFGLTALYATLSGLWGVIVTDFVQFLLAMAASIVLAVYAVNAVGGVEILVARLPEHFGTREAALDFFPTPDDAWMPALTLVAYLGVQWWAAWYPGSEPGGGGYVAQRIFSARSERDGLLATLWFTLAHYAVRPWPWILTALSAVVLYPKLDDPGTGYIRAATELLPSGLKGLLLAGFAAAYMSTLSTQLNWGASYLVHDVYLRFVRPKADARTVMRVSRGCTLLLLALSGASTFALAKVGSVEAAWRVLIALGAGTGLVSLLRWYWWRVNAWSEISAMAASLVSFVGFSLAGLNPGDPREGAQLMLLTTLVTTIVWVAVTYLTAPSPEPVLRAFWLRVRPGGKGWGPVVAALGERPEPLWPDLLRWVAGVVCVYSSLFAVGRALLGPSGHAVGYGAVAIASFGFLYWSLRERAVNTAPAPMRTAVDLTGARH
jgi:Na+/proline symporter